MGIVLIKMLFMSFLTARQRFRTGTFISSEDIVGQEKKGAKTGVNEDVERVRRAHLNDMENILPFFCLGLLYIFTEPALSTATLLFRCFIIKLSDRERVKNYAAVFQLQIEVQYYPDGCICICRKRCIGVFSSRN